MFRARAENRRFVYVLLFLTIALFVLEYQDGEKYARLFAFERGAIMHGEVWRLFTWQFSQAGQGWFSFPRPIVLFLSMLLLYFMGAAIEEEWGTRHFVILFAISTLASAGAAALLNIPLLGSYFVNFTLLFIYASIFPQQTFFLFGLLPVKVRWIAWIAAVMLLVGVFLGGLPNIAAVAGSLAAYLYFVSQRVLVVVPKRKADAAAPVPKRDPLESKSVLNAARFVAIRKAVASASVADIDQLEAQCQRDTVPDVNVCPPADFKPQATDGYCIRCEGFSECAARYLGMSRPPESAPDAPVVPEGSLGL